MLPQFKWNEKNSHMTRSNSTIRKPCFFMSSFYVGVLRLMFSHINVDVQKIAVLWTCQKHWKSSQTLEVFHQTSQKTSINGVFKARHVVATRAPRECGQLAWRLFHLELVDDVSLDASPVRDVSLDMAFRLGWRGIYRSWRGNIREQPS